MKSLSRWGSLLVAAVLAAMPALAQEAKKAEPPKPAPSPSEAILESWNDIGRKLIAIAEDLPEDKYDYKPNPDSRTFVSQLIHASASMYYFTDPAQGKKPHLSDDPKRDELQTKAQIVAFVKKMCPRRCGRHQGEGRQGYERKCCRWWATLDSHLGSRLRTDGALWRTLWPARRLLPRE